MLPVIDSNPQNPSALPTPDSYDFFSSWAKKCDWQNQVTLKRYRPFIFSLSRELQPKKILTLHSVEALREYCPSAHIHRIAPVPLLMTVAVNDVLSPTDLALEAFSRALEPKTLQLLPGGHFDAYSGPNFDRNAAFQAQFLKDHLL
jgi:hypothetical protein